MQQLFEEVLTHFQSANQYQKFIKESQKEYDIKIYRLNMDHTFAIDYASNIYNQLNQKYTTAQIKRQPHGWNENERRLYVWFIICFIHMKLLDPIKLVDGQKYWKHISEAFWNKEIPFLKYQLLTIIKSKGRAIWKGQEDELLKKVYPNHQKGEWNEVAKQFYFVSEGRLFKTPKQCRERWQNHLNEQIKRGQWTAEQDKIIFEYVKANGRNWARIIPLLNNSRTEHMIKNRFKAVVNKLKHQKDMSESEEVINLIVKTANENESKRQVKPAEVKKADLVSTIKNENEYQFVQSVELIQQSEEDGAKMVNASEGKQKKKRGRPKKVVAEQPKIMRLKSKNSDISKPVIKIGSINESIKKGQLMEGGRIEGSPSQKVQLLVGGRNFFQSIYSTGNQFFASTRTPYILNNSINFSMRKPFPVDVEDRSLNGMDGSFIGKEQKSQILEERLPKNTVRRSIRLETKVSGFMQ